MCRYTRANPLLVAKTVPCAVFLNALRQHYWLDATTDSTPRAHALTRVRCGVPVAAVISPAAAGQCLTSVCVWLCVCVCVWLCVCVCVWLCVSLLAARGGEV